MSGHRYVWVGFRLGRGSGLRLRPATAEQGSGVDASTRFAFCVQIGCFPAPVQQKRQWTAKQPHACLFRSGRGLRGCQPLGGFGASSTNRSVTSETLDGWRLLTEQIQEVCALVAVRGARLTAAGIAGILRHLGCDDRAHQAKRNVVAVEGAVVRQYDMYRRVHAFVAKSLHSVQILDAVSSSGVLRTLHLCYHVIHACTPLSQRAAHAAASI